MAAMPEAQSGLLADAMKFTGELSCEPLDGDVTVTTGVVAKAVGLRVANAEIRTKGSRNRRDFIKTSQPGVWPQGCRVKCAMRLPIKQSGRSLESLLVFCRVKEGWERDAAEEAAGFSRS
jgi:hypothetical protein